jgi:hypothetical protein
MVPVQLNLQKIWVLVSIVLLYFSVESGNAMDTVHVLKEDLIKLPGKIEMISPPVDACLYLPDVSSVSLDPKINAAYHAECKVYLSENGLYVLRFILHVPDSDGIPMAMRAGRYYAILWRMIDNHVGTLCTNLRKVPIDVWLTRYGDPGGEQFRNNIFLYNYTYPRKGVEWAREFAHELGHYLLPGASGYTDPESWSNGILGERLFISWINEAIDQKIIDPGTLPFADAASLAEYQKKQVTPLIQSMQQNGPSISLLKQNSRSAMDAFTGLILYIDHTWGSRSIFQMLDYLPVHNTDGYSGYDFLTAFMLYMNDRDHLTLLLQKPGGMVYVPKGSYLIDGADNEGVRFVSSSAGIVWHKADGWHIKVNKPGWKYVYGSSTQSWVKQ